MSYSQKREQMMENLEAAVAGAIVEEWRFTRYILGGIPCVCSIPPKMVTEYKFNPEQMFGVLVALPEKTPIPVFFHTSIAELVVAQFEERKPIPMLREIVRKVLKQLEDEKTELTVPWLCEVIARTSGLPSQVLGTL